MKGGKRGKKTKGGVGPRRGDGAGVGEVGPTEGGKGSCGVVTLIFMRLVLDPLYFTANSGRFDKKGFLRILQLGFEDAAWDGRICLARENGRGVHFRGGKQQLAFRKRHQSQRPLCAEMESNNNGIGHPKDASENFSSENGEGSNVVFSREAPLVNSEPGKKDKVGNEKKLSRQDRIELGRMFQGAVSSHDWELAESLILLADPHTLNDALCISLDSIWFLSTQEELHGITSLIKKIISNGAYDFTRAALRTSFLASCVSACQSRTMSLADTVTVMAQR
ncbi:Ankyrin repeat protein SKIP35 [Vitis vinifera]|uniref:Ankyrin repeat protein SKIP35 n=1 Tax=Vitis vinifera TaxID=29760 RepID=A0A438GA28_VITVI|nr:Ankyrin repeat protein SKIP35 [Vitis vinifera]